MYTKELYNSYQCYQKVIGSSSLVKKDLISKLLTHLLIAVLVYQERGHNWEQYKKNYSI